MGQQTCYRQSSMGPHKNESGVFCILQFARPGGSSENIAILLLDERSDRMHHRFLENYSGIADDDDVEVLIGLGVMIRDMMHEGRGGKQILQQLLDTLSNTLRITDPVAVPVDDFIATLNELFTLYVEPPRFRCADQ
jgi:hypothetical protein